MVAMVVDVSKISIEEKNITRNQKTNDYLMDSPNMCTQQQRLARIDEMCEKYYGHPAKPFLIDNMTDEQVKRLGEYTQS